MYSDHFLIDNLAQNYSTLISNLIQVFKATLLAIRPLFILQIMKV